MLITHINPWLAAAFIAVVTLYFMKAYKYRKLKFQLEETGKSHRLLVDQLADYKRKEHFWKTFVGKHIESTQAVAQNLKVAEQRIEALHVTIDSMKKIIDHKNELLYGDSRGNH